MQPNVPSQPPTPPGRPPQGAPTGWLAAGDPPAAPSPPEGRKPRGTIGWDILLGLNMGAIGLIMLSHVVAYLLFLTTGRPILEGDPDAGPAILVFNLLQILVIFGIIPLIWVLGTRVDPVKGAIRFLGMERPWPAVIQGLGLGVVMAGAATLLLLGLEAIGVPMEDTGMGLRFAGITWALIIATGLVAGFAEEIFFRGILQKWVGVWGQAVFFGLMHLAGGWLAFLVTGLVGLFYGYLVRRGHSLWLVIVAHAVYNITLLSMAMIFAPLDVPEALLWWSHLQA